jgi:hypothetical protein
MGRLASQPKGILVPLFAFSGLPFYGRRQMGARVFSVQRCSARYKGSEGKETPPLRDYLLACVNEEGLGC